MSVSERYYKVIQDRIIEEIKNDPLNAELTNGIVIRLEAIYNYLPDFSKEDIKEAIMEWDIQVLNEGIIIPGKYF